MTIQSILRAHPRLPRLMVTRTLAASLALSGCVPATQWEEASSAAEVEAEGHRRVAERLNAAEAELERTKLENQKLAEAKAALEAQLQKEERRLAQTAMDMESSKKEQEQQIELVTQLRGELARVGDHLKSYQSDKDGLEVKLSAAEVQVESLKKEIEHLRSRAQASEETQGELRAALKDIEENEAPAEQADEQADAQESDDAPAAPEDEAEEVLPSDAASEEES